MTTSPYAAAPPEKLDEIIRLAELQLAAQLTIGIAADQRAMTLASFMASLSAAVIAFWALSPNAAAVPFAVLLTGFAVAAICSAFAAQPLHWQIAGNEPGHWLEDIAEGDTLHNGKAAMAEFYHDMIRANADCLTSNANLVRASFLAMVLTPILGFFARLLWG